ncbi:MAG TPA: YceI family protein [Steroidobacteraceae bacterium]|nr:YceI family protein [Steroidobacteraceae bacterium]
MIRKVLLAVAALVAGAAVAEPVTYTVDPSHTYPAFEADHMGGMSVWRGKIKSTSGSFTLDKAAKSGEVSVTMNMASIDFGHDKMSEHARSADMFDVAKFPTATYKGKVSKWNGDAPAEVDGELTLHGVTKPVKLTLNSFMCKANPMTRKETCGADAAATINRGDFGVSYGKDFGFKMDVKVLISIEAVRS